MTKLAKKPGIFLLFLEQQLLFFFITVQYLHHSQDTSNTLKKLFRFRSTNEKIIDYMKMCAFIQTNTKKLSKLN